LTNINENVNSSSSNVIQTALSQTADIAVKNTDGSWGGAYNPSGWVQPVVNPSAVAQITKDKVNRFQFWGSAYADIKFTDDLSLRNEVSGGYSTAIQDYFSPTYKMGRIEKTYNNSSYNFSKNISEKISNYITYNHSFNARFNTNVMVGHEAQLSLGEGVGAARKNFPSNNVQVISSGDATTATNSGTKSQDAMESYFGRANFGIDDKYLFTVNVRDDGSSIFNSENRWVTTSSAVVAWRISNEKFLKNVGNINDVKLRLSYGLTNNPGGRAYAYTTVLSTVPNSLSGISQLTSKLGNPDLGWEKTKNANIGLDAAFFKSRLSFSVDFYERRTEGLTMQTYLPYYSATSIGWTPGAMDAPYVNIGTVSNKGFEFKISSKNITGKNFTWGTDLTVSHNANKVLKLNSEDAAIYGTYSKTVVGRSIGEFYGYILEGVYSKASDFLGDKTLGIEPHARPVKNGELLAVGTASGSIWYGDRMFKDINGDGIIDERDQTYLGSPIPKVQLGINNTFSYKNLDLNVFFTANIGNKVFNQLRINGESPSGSYGYQKVLMDYAKLALIDPNGSASDVRNVYVTNSNTMIAGVRNDDTNGNNRTSSEYIEDGSFLKCKTISIGYRFSEKLLKKTPIQSLRIYANVTNVFTITKYKGMDPEIGSWDPINAGVDTGFYPQSRVYTLGVNISLNK
jgi:TonB-dependent starch-binding outer membrane protein SusC